MNSMFDELSGADHRTLIGHTGPVYGVCFSPDKYYLISGSEDSTSNNSNKSVSLMIEIYLKVSQIVRLWCLLTFSCLVNYKGHTGPIWDVKFGYYNIDLSFKQNEKLQLKILDLMDIILPLVAWTRLLAFGPLININLCAFTQIICLTLK